MMISKILSQYDIKVASAEEYQLQRYMEEILEWNKSVNLTAITEQEDFIVKHYVDSLSVMSLPEYKSAKTIIDVGTGGGFPGVPLAIFSRDKEFVLLDSLAKRLNIIETICEKIGIDNIRTVHGRAEDLGRADGYREEFDLVLSRAVAELSTLSEYCFPFVRIGGSFISYKGTDVENELRNAEKSINTMGGRFNRIVETIPGHALVILSKERKTPKSYPRRAGTPSKSPIK